MIVKPALPLFFEPSPCVVFDKLGRELKRTGNHLVAGPSVEAGEHHSSFAHPNDHYVGPSCGAAAPSHSGYSDDYHY